LLEAIARHMLGVTSVASFTRDRIETFVAETLERRKPTTGAVRYKSLQQLSSG
jgi:hypothetical protein